MKIPVFLIASLFCGACQATTPVNYSGTKWSQSIPAAAFYCSEGVFALKAGPELYAKCMRHFGAMF